MQILNLIYKEKSDISYEIIHFPDGESHIKLDEINRKDSVEVKCRICNSEDLFIIMQVGDILNRQEVEWGLNIYYLMSMRMDRVISFNESFSLKVVTDVINSLNPSFIYLHHTHSLMSITKFLPLKRMVKDVDRWYFYDLLNSELYDGIKYQICFPDKGAYERYRDDCSKLYNVLVGKKNRNIDTGKIESIVIQNPENCRDYPIMVIDDLCDGGGTFVGIAEAIKSIDPDARLSIYVYHMVNRKGIENLSKVYDTVIFTNSYKDWDNLPDNCKMINVIE